MRTLKKLCLKASQNSLFTLLLILGVLALCASCGADAGNVDASEVSEPSVSKAEEALQSGEIPKAYQIYEAFLDSQPTLEPDLSMPLATRREIAQAYVGRSITRLLLIPYSEATTKMIVDGLGGKHGFKEEDNLIYRNEGLLEVMRQGATRVTVTHAQKANTKSDPTRRLAGTLALFGDESPWAAERIDQQKEFFAPLNQPVGSSLLKHFESVADSMQTSIDDIDRALDPKLDFKIYLFPPIIRGSDQRSWYHLEKKDLLLLKSLFSAAQTVGYFLASFDEPWSLSQLFAVDVTEGNSVGEPFFLKSIQLTSQSIVFLSNHFGTGTINQETLNKARRAAIETVKTTDKLAELLLNGDPKKMRFDGATFLSSDALIYADDFHQRAPAIIAELERSISLSYVSSLFIFPVHADISLAPLFTPNFFQKLASEEWFTLEDYNAIGAWAKNPEECAQVGLPGKTGCWIPKTKVSKSRLEQLCSPAIHRISMSRIDFVSECTGFMHWKNFIFEVSKSITSQYDAFVQ